MVIFILIMNIEIKKENSNNNSNNKNILCIYSENQKQSNALSVDKYNNKYSITHVLLSYVIYNVMTQFIN